MALAGAGVEVGLWASDQSALATSLLPPCSPVHRLIGTPREALDRFGNPDILHDNGIWLAHNHRWAVLSETRLIPRVVSTRGMLEPWALRHKQFKKRIAWQLYQRRDLRQAHYHHTTANPEALNLQALQLGVPIVTVPNGVQLPDEQSSLAAAGGAHGHPNALRVALFLGRIYPVKGLPILIEAWARTRPIGWTLRIVGPDEAGHQKHLQAAIDSAGLHEVITFVGPLADRMKNAAFFNAELFVLPSYSESFGIAVAEALAHGLPVLTTTGTPWSMLRDNGCGWWVGATVDCIADALAEATSLDSESLSKMGSKGRALVAEHFCWPRIADRFVSVYNGMLNRATGTAHKRFYTGVNELANSASTLDSVST
jgi:glycosyltransferase involved in cell wall biosynthesis